MYHSLNAHNIQLLTEFPTSSQHNYSVIENFTQLWCNNHSISVVSITESKKLWHYYVHVKVAVLHYNLSGHLLPVAEGWQLLLMAKLSSPSTHTWNDFFCLHKGQVCLLVWKKMSQHELLLITLIAANLWSSSLISVSTVQLISLPS